MTRAPYVLSKAAPGGPDREMYFYTMYLYDTAFTFLKMGYASAMAFIYFGLMTILLGIVYLFLMQRAKRI